MKSRTAFLVLLGLLVGTVLIGTQVIADKPKESSPRSVHLTTRQGIDVHFSCVEDTASGQNSIQYHGVDAVVVVHPDAWGLVISAIPSARDDRKGEYDLTLRASDGVRTTSFNPTNFKTVGDVTVTLNWAHGDLIVWRSESQHAELQKPTQVPTK